MPSYRLLVDVVDVRPGIRPEAVEETLVRAVADGAFVEAHDLDVVAGVARLRVRFLVPAGSGPTEDAAAARVGVSAWRSVGAVALVRNPRILRRTPRARWLALRVDWGSCPPVANITPS